MLPLLIGLQATAWSIVRFAIVLRRASRFGISLEARPITLPIQYASSAFKSTSRVFADYFPVLAHNENAGNPASAASKSICTWR